MNLKLIQKILLILDSNKRGELKDLLHKKKLIKHIYLKMIFKNVIIRINL